MCFEREYFHEHNVSNDFTSPQCILGHDHRTPSTISPYPPPTCTTTASRRLLLLFSSLIPSSSSSLSLSLGTTFLHPSTSTERNSTPDTQSSLTAPSSILAPGMRLGISGRGSPSKFSSPDHALCAALGGAVIALTYLLSPPGVEGQSTRKSMAVRHWRCTAGSRERQSSSRFWQLCGEL